ncbi:Gfo/Idh/MocA family oxidoreductase [Bosea sp. CS1GBMeth4]|uniref:Gfo/Idh/MocA family protein n=1 Tax=Bosea sp. CS1GBMeth4 TaxID=1892849 RepID=UPI0016494110|nr:Gfo/Idh/MocA family oxidoreductase [Bosea sp. CS1GBMeth4]
MIASRPRLGFLGLGWIGLDRMKAILASGTVEVAGFVDPAPEAAGQAHGLAPGARQLSSLEDLLALGLDGLVVATPNALHAAQSLAALRAGVAVFCQKPLGRTAEEVREVVSAAREADRLLGVDLSYRWTEGMQRLRDLVRTGTLGRVHALDLVFHNAYGPDKPWFYDRRLAGGGCVMDLGIHLVDLALWLLDFPKVHAVGSHLFAGGEPLAPDSERVEDYAAATLELDSGAVVRLACSWRLHAGRDAVIAAEVYGSRGGAAFRNIDGSFYDFVTEHFSGTTGRTMTVPPDRWGGRAACDWARRLARGGRHDPESERLVDVAEVLDRIYRR